MKSKKTNGREGDRGHRAKTPTFWQQLAVKSAYPLMKLQSQMCLEKQRGHTELNIFVYFKENMKCQMSSTLFHYCYIHILLMK